LLACIALRVELRDDRLGLPRSVFDVLHAKAAGRSVEQDARQIGWNKDENLIRAIAEAASVWYGAHAFIRVYL